jgi:phenylalanyl-tRNA synthetase alpha subunit
LKKYGLNLLTILIQNHQWKFLVFLYIILGFHPLLKKKVEVGNSGIFRPEMLRPMGFPEDVSVIAWGLSL